jgi:hypothetical protein
VFSVQSLSTWHGDMGGIPIQMSPAVQTPGLAIRTPCNHLGSMVEADRGNHVSAVPASVLASQLSICLSEIPCKEMQIMTYREHLKTPGM